jgi:tryptophan halogenase
MKIVIVGGGTAGWLAAATLVKETVGHDITVIESSKYGIIGAGEGSTGSFPWFINQEWPNNLVNEMDFIKKAKGTIKLGINLKNWKGDGTNTYSPINSSITSRNHIDISFLGSILKNGRGDASTLQYYLLKERMVPFLKSNRKSALGHNTYSYHFDGHAVGEYFKNICTKLGVKVIDAAVNDTTFDENENLKSITLDDGTLLTGDMWFDCSGFARVLMSKTKNKWISYKDYLPVNTAIPFSTPISSRTVNFETESTALNSGWMWKIPLQERYGNGYVVCDAFQSFDKSVEEIEKHLGHKIEPIREIKFEAGKYEDFWYKNIAAVGLSSHFLEPLQATSIHTSIIAVTNLVNHYIKSVESVNCEISRKRFNQNMNVIIEDIKNLLQMHYLAGREDTPFWKAIKNEMKITEKNKELIEISKHRLINMMDFDSGHGVSGWPIWCHILDMAGLFDKDMIEKELKSHNQLSQAIDTSKLMKFDYNKLKPTFMTNEEFFKYLKI